MIILHHVTFGINDIIFKVLFLQSSLVLFLMIIILINYLCGTSYKNCFGTLVEKNDIVYLSTNCGFTLLLK